MPVESTYINTLYQANDGLLYIGTNGSGVLIYDPGNMSFEHYYADNSALVSNSIYTILPEMNGQIMMSTENGITSFSIEKRSFHNWSREQGMMSACLMQLPVRYVRIIILFLAVLMGQLNFRQV